MKIIRELRKFKKDTIQFVKEIDEIVKTDSIPYKVDLDKLKSKPKDVIKVFYHVIKDNENIDENIKKEIFNIIQSKN